MADVEETLKRIHNSKGVAGYVVINNEGIPIRTSMDNSTTLQYCGAMRPIIQRARAYVRDIDPSNDLQFLRIRSRKNEVMLAPMNDYTLLVLQSDE